jgi:hypothetical protein
MRDVISLQIHLPSHEIALFCNLMAGYEGVAIIRTLDPAQGYLELLVAPDFYATAHTLLQVLAQEIALQVLSPPPQTIPS